MSDNVNKIDISQVFKKINPEQKKEFLKITGIEENSTLWEKLNDGEITESDKSLFLGYIEGQEKNKADKILADISKLADFGNEAPAPEAQKDKEATPTLSVTSSQGKTVAQSKTFFEKLKDRVAERYEYLNPEGPQTLTEGRIKDIRHNFKSMILKNKKDVDAQVLSNIKKLDDKTFKQIFADPEFIAEFNTALYDWSNSTDIIYYLLKRMSALAPADHKLQLLSNNNYFMLKFPNEENKTLYNYTSKNLERVYETVDMDTSIPYHLCYSSGSFTSDETRNKNSFVRLANAIRNDMKVEAEAKAKAEAEATVLTNIKTLQGEINKNLDNVKNSKVDTDKQKTEATNISGAIDADVKKAEEAKTSAEAQKTVNDAESKLKSLEIILDKAKVEPPFVESELKKAQDEVGKINDFTPKNADATKLVEQVNKDISTVGKLVVGINGNVADIQKLVDKAKVAVVKAKAAVSTKEKAEAKEAEEAARKAKEAEDARKAKEAEDARKAKEAEDARKAKEAKAEVKPVDPAQPVAPVEPAKPADKSSDVTLDPEDQAIIDSWDEKNMNGADKTLYTWAPIKNLPIVGHEEEYKELQELKAKVAEHLPKAKEGEFDFYNVDRFSMKALDVEIDKATAEIEKAQKTLDTEKANGAPDDVLETYKSELENAEAKRLAFGDLKSFIMNTYKLQDLGGKDKPLGFEEQLPQLDVAKLNEEDKKAYDAKLVNIKERLDEDEFVIDTDLSKFTVADWNDVIAHYNKVLNDPTISDIDKTEVKTTIAAIEDYKDFTFAKALEQAEPGFLTKAAVAAVATRDNLLGIAKYLTGDIAKDIIAAGHRTEYLYKDGYSEGGFSGFAKGTLQGAVGTVLNTGTTVVNAGSSLVGKTTDMLEGATDRTDNMDDGNKKSIAKGVNSGLKLTSAVANLAGGILDWASYGISGDYVLGQNEILEKITNKTIDFLESKKDDKSPEYVNEMRFVTDLCKQLNVSKAELDKMEPDAVRELIKNNYNMIDADLLVKNATVLGMKAQFDNAKNLLIVTDATGTAKLKKAGEQAVGAVVDAAGLVGGTLSEVGEATSALGKVFVPTGNGIGKDLDNLGKEIKDIADMPANIVNTVTDSVEAIVDDIPAVGGGVAKTVDGASNIVTGLAGSVTGLVTGQFSDAGESVVNAGKGVLNVGKGLVNTVTFGTLFGDAIDDVKDAAEDAKDYLEDVREELADAKEETDLEDKKEEIEDATKYAQKAMKAANEALLEAQKVADAAQKDAAKKLTEAAYNDALTALNEVNEVRKAVGLPEIPNTLKLQKDIKKTASVADVKAQAVDNSDFVKNIKPQLEKRMDKIIESMIPAETMKKLSIALADDELKKLNEVINSDDSTKADKDNAKYSKLVILAAMTTDEAKKDDYINQMIKFYGKEDPDYFEVANLRARIEDQIAAWDKANKEKVHKPFSEILMAGFSKFEANRIAQRAQNAALFGDNKDDWSWTSFWNAVDHTPAQELNAGDRGFWANSGSVLKGFMAGIPSALLRDSSLTAWQAASTVPFMEHIGPLNAFFLMGLGAKEHIEGAIDIVNGKYNSAQKASGYEQQGYAILKDIVVWWSHHHNNHVRSGKPSEPCKPNDPMNTDPGFFDPTQWDPSKVPFIE